MPRSARRHSSLHRTRQLHAVRGPTGDSVIDLALCHVWKYRSKPVSTTFWALTDILCMLALTSPPIGVEGIHDDFMECIIYAVFVMGPGC